jgi:vacuolar-type H+-ATPase subunit E/Vma4
MNKDLLNKINMENADAICGKIRQDAEYESQNLFAASDQKAEKILAAAKAEAEKRRLGLEQETDKEVQRIKERIFSTLNLEKKRLTLGEKDRFVEAIFEQVRKNAEEFRSSPEYKTFLEKAAIEGIKVIGQTDIEVFYSFLDEHIINDGFIKKIEGLCSDVMKQKCTVKSRKSDFKDIGIIINSRDGRMMFDNRFLSRLNRSHEDIYMELLKEVF